MATSSLTSSLTSLSLSLSLPSSSNPQNAPSCLSFPKPKLQLHSFSSRTNNNNNFVVKVAVSTDEPTLDPSSAADADATPNEPEIVNVAKYVKSRMPGGIAAQPYLATGYRKTAIARVALQDGTGKIFVNHRHAEEYFQGNPFYLQYCRLPLTFMGYEDSYDIFVKVQGGGLSGQAQAVCLGVARALVKISDIHKRPLKEEGFLTRDIRIVERKKAGFKKARKRPQFSKR